jgi:alkylation response protein AidB-like acyl-CoA dehydrogenase
MTLDMADAASRTPAAHAEPLTVAGLRAAIAPILERLGVSAAAREAARDYAFADVRALARTGVAMTVVPRDEGGAGGSLRDVVEIVAEIARADSNVAQALRHTFISAWTVTSRPDTPHRDRTLSRLRQGHIFATTGNERNGGASGSVSTTAQRTGDGWVLNGEKYYSTGGLYADWFSAQAKTADGAVVRFTVPVDREGVERLDDFSAVGQRLTASGTTRLTNVRVSGDEVIVVDQHSPAPGNPWQGTFAQLYLAAVEAGIAARVLDDAVWWVREKARPIKHSSADKSIDDPYIRRRIGQISAYARAARSAVLIAAEELDDVRGRSGEEARRAGAQAAIAVAEASVIAIDSALAAAPLIFDVGGGTITNRQWGFDRHWRNARTIANHNPRDWKLAVAGAYQLGAAEPPTSGLF